MAITMKNLNDRISKLEGKASTTPITMKGLNDRLTALEKSSVVSIVTINKSGSNLYPIPTEHQGKNFVVITTSISSVPNGAKENSASITDGKSISTWMRAGGNSQIYGGGTINYTISGTNIVGNYVKNGYGAESITHPSSIKVLFYK